MVAQQIEAVDFYVTPFEGAIGVIRTWVVHRGSPSATYVAVCESREDALSRAIAMSKSQRRIGKASVVHIREKPGAAWRIVPD